MLFRMRGVVGVLGLLLVCGLAIGGGSRGVAGEFNSVLNIGDAAPAWTDLPGVDGKKHSLDDFKGKEFVLVIFTCNTCPIANDYEERIVAFQKKYGADGKLGVVAINVNTVEADKLPAMTQRAKDKGYTFPYISDESQKIGRAYGAAFTPEFFLLNKDRKVVYMGGFDDSSNPNNVEKRYLEDALLALQQGKTPAKAETNAIGCRVRYLRTR